MFFACRCLGSFSGDASAVVPWYQLSADLELRGPRPSWHPKASYVAVSLLGPLGHVNQDELTLGCLKGAHVSEPRCGARARGCASRLPEYSVHGCPQAPELALVHAGESKCCHEMAMVQNQWYHFGIGAPPILAYFSWGLGCSLRVRGFDPWPDEPWRP